MARDHFDTPEPVQELASAIVAALDVPWPADMRLGAQHDRIVAGRTAGVIGALESLAEPSKYGRTLADRVSLAAAHIRKDCMKPPVDYKINSNPDEQTPA